MKKSKLLITSLSMCSIASIAIGSIVLVDENTQKNKSTINEVEITKNKKLNTHSTKPRPDATIGEIIENYERYNGYDLGIVTPAEDHKSNFKLSWAFSVADALETSIIKNGIKGYDINNLNLSEKNIDYVTNVRTQKADKLNNTPYETFSNSLNENENTELALKMLTQGNGFLLKNQNSSNAVDSENRYNENPLGKINEAVVLDYNGNDKVTADAIKDIKEAIIKYGSVIINYNASQMSDFNFKGYLATNSSNANHTSIIVGWDDTVGSWLFDDRSVPTQNGGWIVKNNWGDDWGRFGNGTFVMSYDSKFFNCIAVDVKETPKDLNGKANENIYYYDGNYENKKYQTKATIAASIFKAKKASWNIDEKLTEISFEIDGKNVEANVEVYKNVEMDETDRSDVRNNPISRELVFSGKKECKYPGFYRLKLDKPISLKRDETFSVVVSVKNATNDAFINFSFEPDSLNDMTYILNDDKKTWTNSWIKNRGEVARIRAYTTSEIINGNDKKDLKYADIKLEEKYYRKETFYHYGYTEKPKPIVSYNGITLRENVDYETIYEEETLKKQATDVSELNDQIGFGLIKVIGKGEYNSIQIFPYIICVGIAPKLDGFERSIDNETNVTTYSKTINDASINKFGDIILPDNWEWTEPNRTISSGYNESILKYKNPDIGYFKYGRSLKAGITKSSSVINKKDISSIAKVYLMNDNLNDYEYNGEQIRPKVKVVLWNGDELKENIDYVVNYSNNINASLNNAKVIIVGIGKYNNLINVNFSIKKAKNRIIDFYIDSKTNEPIAVSRVGVVKFKYYADENGENELEAKPEYNGTYYVKAYVDETKNYEKVESNKLLSFVISNSPNPNPPVDPEPEPKPPVEPEPKPPVDPEPEQPINPTPTPPIDDANPIQPQMKNNKKLVFGLASISLVLGIGIVILIVFLLFRKRKK